MPALKIMIVEDDFIVASNLEEFLIKLGYHVVGIGKNSDEALQIYRKHSPDLAFLDIELGKDSLDGIEIASAIYEEQPIPIVYLTGASNKTIVERAKTPFPAYFLTKPCTEEQINIGIEFAIHFFILFEKIKNATVGNTPLEFKALADYFFTKKGTANVKVSIKDIYWVKTDKGCLDIVTKNEKITVYASLNSFCLQVLHSSLVRVHRSFVVNLDHINSYSGRVINIEHPNRKEIISVSDTYMDDFKSKIHRLMTE